MSGFGYVCKCCNTLIRGGYPAGGERCVIIHVRDGIELGRTEGCYDKYGGVVEDKVFCHDVKSSPNSRLEISCSVLDYDANYGEDTGIVAYHSICYQDAIKNNTFDLKPSKLSPYKSYRKARRKYI